MTRRTPALVFLIVLAFMTIRLLTTLAEPGVNEGGYVDFRDAVYAPVNALLDGVDPYRVEDLVAHDPDVGNAFSPYSPHHLLLALPFAVLPIELAGALWWLANVALLLAVCRFVIDRTRPQWGSAGVFGLATIALLSNPGRFNFLTGQPALAIVLGVYVAFTSDRQWVAAGGLAVALIKPQFGLPVLLFLLATGKWRIAAAGTGLAAALSAPIVVALTYIEGGLGNLVDAVVGNIEESQTAPLNPYRIDLLAMLRRQFDVNERTATTLLIALLLLGTATWLLRRWGQIDTVAMTVVGLATLLSFFHLPYDELILLWPIVALGFAGHLGAWRWWAFGLMLAAAFNPLTVRFLDIGTGLDTVTTLLLLGALVAVAFGVMRHPADSPNPAQHGAAHRV